jgi:hypothetical protein
MVTLGHVEMEERYVMVDGLEAILYLKRLFDVPDPVLYDVVCVLDIPDPLCFA